ncbi:MAG: hypothetical protein ABFE01_13960 [Phycisphaerales bacterium]
MRKQTWITVWMCVCAAYLGGVAQAANSIYLEISPCDQCVQPGEQIEVAVKLQGLDSRINLVQATVQFDPAGVFCASDVKPGEPFWTDVIASKRTSNSITFTMGLLPPEFNAIGTMADNTLAILTLTACKQECAGSIKITSAQANSVDSCVCPCQPAQPVTLNCGAAVAITVDETAPVVSITSIKHTKCGLDFNLSVCPCTTQKPASNPCCSGPADYGTCTPGSCTDLACAAIGAVEIYVEATDNCGTALRRPSVQVITACGVVEDITHTGVGSGAGKWKYTFEVTADTAPGAALVKASAVDCAGNKSLVADAAFKVCPKLIISGLIELQGFVGSLREVVFTVTDKAGQTFTSTRVVQFERLEGYCDLVGTYELAAPKDFGEIASIMAKTAWNLAVVHKVVADDYFCGHLVVDFTGADHLLAGDVYTGQNPPSDRQRMGDGKINFVDLSTIQTAMASDYNYWADVNGDGAVSVADEKLVLDNQGK